MHQVSLGDHSKKKLLWITDLHLNALKEEQISDYFQTLSNFEGAALLIGGDICDGKDCLKWLKEIHSKVKCPVYFVLGNHDFHFEKIVDMKAAARKFSEESKGISYLTESEIIPLSPRTALIGADLWADSQEGDFLNSTIRLSDYDNILDLAPLKSQDLALKLFTLGKECADQLKIKLAKAYQDFDTIVLLTHILPFREACLYEGKSCDDNWAPHFICKSAGDMIKEISFKFPSKKLLILSGHSHEKVDKNISNNVRILVGKAEVGKTDIQGLITFS